MNIKLRLQYEHLEHGKNGAIKPVGQICPLKVQCLTFMNEHFFRHLPQIKRLL